MSALDPVLLSRMQFAANITFHILFPSITIALGWVLLFFKNRYNATRDYKWMESYFFWTKIFALSFAVGVVSGITMSFQFGTNWPGFMQTVGNIAGPLLGFEVLTAFFLEATFLGVMLFGFRRVPAWLHTLATFLVAAGTTLSAFWILVLNSWMQTPAGFEMINGQAHATSWLQIILNPSFPYRFVHMLLASGLTASFLVAGISAFRWRRGDRSEAVLSAMKTGLVLGAVLIPVQIGIGDLHGLNTQKYQPQKVAAMEALWETRAEAPLILFALPDESTRTNKMSVEVPGLASLILKHENSGVVRGLDEFENDHPPVAPMFWAFRIMIGMGLLMLFVSWAGVYGLRKNGEPSPWVVNALVLMAFSGWVATVSGWYVTEVGRQPWLVTGVLKTADAVSPVPAPLIGISLGMYLAVYALLLTAFITTIYYMARKAGQGVQQEPVYSTKAVVKAIEQEL